MTKKKLSVTVSPERLQRARELSPGLNVSEVVDNALDALVQRELENRWLRAREQAADVHNEVPVDLSDLPWDDR